MNSISTLFIAHELPRTFFLSVGAFLLAMCITPVYTYVAYRYRYWKRQRSTSFTGEKLEIITRLHAGKFTRNIPTMAGLVVIVAITLATVFNLGRGQTWLPLVALLGGGLVGLLDDIINLRGNDAGMRSSIKFLMISVLGLALGWWFFERNGVGSVHIPFVGDWQLGWLIIPVFAFAVVAMGTAANISDGLDGLAGGLLGLSYGAFGVIALLQGQSFLAGFCFTVVGALLSYVWFNIYPARFFMGDVGSFALGAALGVVAMLTNTLFLLPVIGIVFVAEAGSSLIQIISKRVGRRKVFMSAPLHHHLEAIGWPETKVTMRFWVIGSVAAFVGVYLALAGGNIIV